VFYSGQNKILFIAPPKTGSTSVEKQLVKVFDDGKRFQIELPDRTVTSRDVKTPSLGHAKAVEIRDAVSVDVFSALSVFGFVRDPIEKLVSSYFFTRSRTLSDAFQMGTKRSKSMLIVRRVSTILLARVLPLWLWSLVFRMRDCSSYFTDRDGKLIVDYLGSIQRLSQDLNAIFDDIGLNVGKVAIPRINTSKHRKPRDYWFFRLFIPMLQKRYAADIALYAMVKDGVWINPKRASDRVPE